MARRLQHDMTGGPSYAPWIVVAVVAILLVVGFVWAFSGNSNTTAGNTKTTPSSPATTGLGGANPADRPSGNKLQK